MTERDPVMSATLAKARWVAFVIEALGPEYERAGEQLADRLWGVIAEHSATVANGAHDERLAALGIAVTQACHWTLSLLAAVARAKRADD